MFFEPNRTKLIPYRIRFCFNRRTETERKWKICSAHLCGCRQTLFQIAAPSTVSLILTKPGTHDPCTNTPKKLWKISIRNFDIKFLAIFRPIFKAAGLSCPTGHSNLFVWPFRVVKGQQCWWWCSQSQKLKVKVKAKAIGSEAYKAIRLEQKWTLRSTSDSWAGYK